jgi:hypothetical protein
MKKTIIIIVCMMLPLASFAQFEGVDWGQYQQEQKELKNIIESEVKAQIRQQQTKANQSQTPMMRSQTQTTQSQTQTVRQQALENFNNRISNEGQIRMGHINNPDVYIDRSITNMKPSLNANSTNSTSRYNSPNQSSDLRTRPVHSEELTSKSLQMLHEANREYFSNEDRETTINPNAIVPLFDAPSLGVPLFESSSVGEKPVEEMDMETVYAELSPEQKSVYDKMKKEILDRIVDRQEFVEYQDQIAYYNNLFNDSGFDGAQSAVIRNSFQKHEAKKELDKAKKELQELEEWAKEAVRNNRSK